MRYFLMMFFLMIFLYGCGDGDSPDSNSAGRTINLTNELSFIDESGNEISNIRIAVADTPNKRNMGLMDVRNLPADAGMLFIFEGNEPRSFWMANTPLSLDIIYANSSFEIVRIHRSTTPFSEAQILSEYPAKYVVEVNAGYTREFDIREGMFISFEL